MNSRLQPNNQTRQTRGFDFFREFLREPDIVGSIIPSSRFLEAKIINAACLADSHVVIELGPGTGGTTCSFLQHMPPESRLLTIEISQAFTDFLNNIEDPRLINHCGSAMEIASILRQYDLPAPDVVISGIPFSTIQPATGRQIIETVRDNLKPGGRFIAYQFRGQVSRLAKPLFGDPDVTQELRNIPPMRVFRWQKHVSKNTP